MVQGTSTTSFILKVHICSNRGSF